MSTQQSHTEVVDRIDQSQIHPCRFLVNNFGSFIDPESNTVRSYYTDFLVQKEDGTYVIVEVKGDNKIEDPVVLTIK